MTDSPIIDRLDRTAKGAVLLTPLLLLHAHGIAEGAIAIADLCFLVRSHLTKDWGWTRARWLLVGWAWWGWLVVCSTPIPALSLGEGGMHSFIQALAVVRFLVFLAALEQSVLRAPETRRWMFWIVAGCTAYIAVQSLFQYVFGFNFYGWKTGPDGELTGPFGKPRAGAPYARMLLPAIVPAAAAFFDRPGVRSKALGGGLLIGGLAVSLLIGQRMPFILAAFGLVVVALLLPKLRWGVVIAGVAAAALLAASPVIAPKAYHRLVEEFSTQMAHFATTHYGELYTRAWEIGVRNPATGLGFEGFGTGCPNPAYFRPTFDGSKPDGGGKVICWDHPHQYYLEALDTGGFPGLILFSGLAFAWLAALSPGLLRTPNPLRAALFAAALMQLWPIASASAFTSMPLGGWSFLLLGWGLAETKWGQTLAERPR